MSQPLSEVRVVYGDDNDVDEPIHVGLEEDEKHEV